MYHIKRTTQVSPGSAGRVQRRLIGGRLAVCTDSVREKPAVKSVEGRTATKIQQGPTRMTHSEPRDKNPTSAGETRGSTCRCRPVAIIRITCKQLRWQPKADCGRLCVR